MKNLQTIENSQDGIKLFKKRSILTAFILLCALGFTVYTNSMNGDFVWDDKNLVQNNPLVKSWPDITGIFTQDIAGKQEAVPYGYYRPFTVMTYALNWAVGNFNVEIYHFTNIVLHILTAFSIYFLVLILFHDAALALLTAFLFVVHPVHTEAVTYISGRAGILSALFMILSFIFYIQYQKSGNKRLYAFMLIGYALALLSKENSFIFPAVLLLYHYIFKKEFKIKAFLPVLGLWAVCFYLRSVFLGFSLFNPDASDWGTSLARLPGFFVAIGSYLRLLFFPFDLHMEYGNYYFHPYDFRFIAGVLISVLLLSYALRKRTANVLLSFSICWFFVTLLPNSSIYPVTAFYMAEHWLYLPSVGFFIIISRWLINLYRLKRLKILALFLMLGIALFYSSLTIKQNNYWREPIAFYKRTLKYAPWSERVYYNLGLVYSRLGNYPEAIKMYKKAIMLKPEEYSFYNNLGSVYAYSGNYPEAITMYKKTIALNSNHSRAHFNLAQVYFAVKQYKLAVQYCDRAIELGHKVSPDFLELLKPYRQ